jgi:hypothetical protein
MAAAAPAPIPGAVVVAVPAAAIGGVEDASAMRLVKLVVDAEGRAPVIAVPDFDWVAWFMIHLYVYAAPFGDKKMTGADAITRPGMEGDLHRWIGYHALHLPCGCRVSGKLLLNENPPPIGRDRQAWWEWSVHYHNVVRASIGLDVVSTTDATRFWNARFHARPGPSDIELESGHDVSLEQWLPIFWRNLFQTCWSFRQQGTARSQELTFDYLRLTVALAPDDGLIAPIIQALFRTFPPPVHRSRDDLWDWACAFHQRAHSSVSTIVHSGELVSPLTGFGRVMSSDAATEFWNSEFQRGATAGTMKPADPMPSTTAASEAGAEDVDVRVFIVYAALVAAEVAAAMDDVDRAARPRTKKPLAEKKADGRV